MTQLPLKQLQWKIMTCHIKRHVAAKMWMLRSSAASAAFSDTHNSAAARSLPQRAPDPHSYVTAHALPHSTANNRPTATHVSLPHTIRHSAPSSPPGCPSPLPILSKYSDWDIRGQRYEIDADTINQVIEEAGKFCSEVIFPLNQSGDREGCTYHGDGVVTVSDVLNVLSEFGCTAKCAMDINGDGATNVTDVLAVLSAFGTACN